MEFGGTVIVAGAVAAAGDLLSQEKNCYLWLTNGGSIRLVHGLMLQGWICC
jgi:hypothetical protein